MLRMTKRKERPQAYLYACGRIIGLFTFPRIMTILCRVVYCGDIISFYIPKILHGFRGSSTLFHAVMPYNQADVYGEYQNHQDKHNLENRGFKQIFHAVQDIQNQAHVYILCGDQIHGGNFILGIQPAKARSIRHFPQEQAR